MSKAQHYFEKIPRKEPQKRDVRTRIRDLSEITRATARSMLVKQATRCITCGIPACELCCPLANRIGIWTEMVADGKFLEAARVAYRTNPMPEVTGRICPRDLLCELHCVLRERFGSVTIGDVERHLGESHYDAVVGEMNRRIEKNGIKVAVIGSGPAGFSCADFLSRLGYAITVFERDSHPGGLLYYGVPSFKLDKRIIKRRIKALENRGVDFQCDKEFGKDVSLPKLKTLGFGAFFLGLGAKKEITIPELATGYMPNVITACLFLRGENDESASWISVKNKRVLVLGGGDTAMDCARTAIRKGARDVTCVYRESEETRPGSKREYEAAIEEGVKMVDRYSPLGFTAGQDGNLKEVKFMRVEISGTEENGCSVFKEIQGMESSCAADVFIISLGFLPEMPILVKESGIETDNKNRIKVGSDQMTNAKGIFAGGDICRGPSLVVHALRDGREAAFGIDRYLRGQHKW